MELQNDNAADEKPKAKTLIPMVDLDRMVADSLKDVDVDDDADDVDDPDLLNELSKIIQDEPDSPVVPPSSVADGVVPTLLKDRIEMYKVAETNATAANESGRARRFARGISVMETMVNDAVAGKPINMDDIPPEVSIGVKDSSVPAKNVNAD